MTTHSAWKPARVWHAKVFGALLAACTAAYFALAYATDKLPAPYQKHRPAPEAAPWTHPAR